MTARKSAINWLDIDDVLATKKSWFSAGFFVSSPTDPFVAMKTERTILAFLL